MDKINKKSFGFLSYLKNLLRNIFPSYYTRVLYYSYPQYIWAKEIKKILNRINNPDFTIIDAPCGDGIISYWLEKSFKNDFELYDISLKAIEKAKENIKGVKIFCNDVANIPANNKKAIWLLINSFFLLSDIEDSIQKLRNRVDYIICIFPELTSKDFLLWKKENPDYFHPNEMNFDDTVLFFANQGYQLYYQKKTIKISHYSKRLSLFYPLYLRIFNLCEFFFSARKSYSFNLVVFKKSFNI